MSTCATETRTALYRFYDAREDLLYVGITDDPWRRWRQHVLAKPWYPRVKHQSVTWYDTRNEAEVAEKRAILAERPEFNIAGALRPPERHPRLTSDFATKVCVAWACGAMVFGAVSVSIVVKFRSPDLLWVQILKWFAIVGYLSIPVPVIAVLLVTCAPWAYRFGCWLNRTFGDCQTNPAVAEIRTDANVSPIAARR